LYRAVNSLLICYENQILLYGKQVYNTNVLLCVCVCVCVARANVFGIATRYGLDAPRIESRWGSRFFVSVHTGPGAHPSFYTIGTGSYLRVTQPGRGLETLPPNSAEVKEWLEKYLYSPSGLSWSVAGPNLPLHFFL
jgi:hypothetical protein